jgi:hypothetical protein
MIELVDGTLSDSSCLDHVTRTFQFVKHVRLGGVAQHDITWLDSINRLSFFIFQVSLLRLLLKE